MYLTKINTASTIRNQLMMHRSLLVAPLFLAALLGAPRAMAAPANCSNDPYDGERLVDVLALFQSDEYVGIRDSLGIQQVPTDAQTSVISDEKTCGSLATAAHKELRGLAKDAGEKTSLAGQTLFFFGIGDYYAVLMLPGEDTTSELVLSGLAPLLVFRANSFEYIGYVNM